MKKTVSTLLVLLLLLCLTACGSISNYVSSEVQELKEIFGGKNEEAVWGEAEAAEALVKEETASGAGLHIDLEEIFDDREGYAGEAPSAEVTAGFDVITVADNETCTVKITGVRTDTIWGCTVDLCLENHTRRNQLSFNLDSAYINGLRCYPHFYADVEGEEAVLETLYLTDDVIRGSGIEAITDIKLTFSVFDYSDWSAEEMEPMTVTIYPQGEENAVRYVREPQESDAVLLENDDISARLVGFEADPGWSYDAIIYLENSAKYDVDVAIDSVRINGIAVEDCFFYESIDAGTSAFARMQCYAEFFEENSITQIDELELMIQVYDTEDYDLLAEEWVTVIPE